MATDPAFMNSDYFVESKSSNSNKIFIKTISANSDIFLRRLNFPYISLCQNPTKNIKENRISKT